MDLLQQLKNMTDEEFIRIAMDGAKGLNRQHKRQMEREITEEAKVLRSLTSKQMQLMQRYANAKAREKSEEQVLKYITLMDTCLTAYFYLKHEDMTPAEVLKETTLINDMVIEYRDMLNDLIRECGGNEDMAGKELEKISKEVKIKCVELVNEGKNQKDALEILQSEFPTMKKAVLVNAYKNTKVKIKAEQAERDLTPKQLAEADKLQEEKEIEAAVEYIFEEPKKKIKDTKNESGEEKVSIDPKELEVSIQPEVNLRRVERREVFEGDFGKYEINNQELLFGDLKFENMDQVEEYEEKARREFESRIAELKVVMAKI